MKSLSRLNSKLFTVDIRSTFSPLFDTSWMFILVDLSAKMSRLFGGVISIFWTTTGASKQIRRIVAARILREIRLARTLAEIGLLSRI